MLENFELGTFSIDRDVVDIAGRAMLLEKIVEGDGRDLDDAVLAPCFPVGVARLETQNSRKLRMLRGGKVHPFPCGAKDATEIDICPSVSGEVGVPCRIGFGQDAAPAEIALEQAGVAEAHAVGRADLDEIAVSLAPCLVQHP